MTCCRCLLAAQEDGEGMSDRQVHDEALTLFLAGHETTSNALTWTWWLLSRHPDAEARLHAELDAVLDGRAPDDRRPARPAVHDGRPVGVPAAAPACLGDRASGGRGPRPRRDDAAGGLGRGRLAVAPASRRTVVARRDGRSGPERWLDPDPDRPRHAYLPFGGGPRMCIGEGFAWMEAGLVLATLARRWRFTLEPGARVEMQPVVTLRPRHGCRCWRGVAIGDELAGTRRAARTSLGAPR